MKLSLVRVLTVALALTTSTAAFAVESKDVGERSSVTATSKVKKVKKVKAKASKSVKASKSTKASKSAKRAKVATKDAKKVRGKIARGKVKKPGAPVVSKVAPVAGE